MKFKHLRSSVAGKLPQPADIDVGQIAINFNDGDPFLSIKDSAGAVRRLGGSSVGNTAPGSPVDGALWVDTSANPPILKIYDLTNTAWIDASPDATTSSKGIVQLADAAAIVAGTAGRVVDAAQLKANRPPDASETVKGIAEIATTAEVTTGTDDTRIVTPAKLKAYVATNVPDATETIKGIAEIATTAEVNTGTDDERIVTPLKLQAYVTEQLKATWLPGDHIAPDDVGTATWNGSPDTLTATPSVEVSIAGGAWGTGGAANSGDQVQVRWIASAVTAAAHGATLTGRVENASGNVGVDYNATIDKLPADDITVNAKTGAAVSAVSESDSSTAVHGINAPARLWLDSSDGTTPEVSIAGGAWTAVPATAAAGLAVSAGQTFKLRHTTQAGASTVTTTTVRVGWDAGNSVTASYASTNVATKAPVVGAVTLADVPGGGRFTSTAFPVSATMTDDGIPASTKKLKAYVEGSFTITAKTSVITGVAYGANTVLTFADSTGLADFNLGDDVEQDSGHTPTSSAITNVAGNVLTLTDDTDLANFRVGDIVQEVRLDTPAGFAVAKNSSGTVVDYPDTTAGDKVQIAASVPFNMASTAAQAIPDQPAALSGVSTQLIFDLIDSSSDFDFIVGSTGWNVYGSVDGINWVRGPSFSLSSYTSARSLLDPSVATARYVMISYAAAGIGWGSAYGGFVKFNQAYINAFNAPHPPAQIPGVDSSNVKITAIDEAAPSITTDGGTWNVGDVVTGPATTPATGTVASVDTGTNTMVLSASDETGGKRWIVNEGKFVKWKNPHIVANAKLFCKLDAAGAVSDLQSADPGFTAWTPAGAGPYTGTVTFPATLPTGNAPDADLPAGTTITVEVEASNASGTDSATSNTVTPA